MAEIEVFSEVISDNTPKHTSYKKATAKSGLSFHKTINQQLTLLIGGKGPFNSVAAYEKPEE
jgi:hypothetical protein